MAEMILNGIKRVTSDDEGSRLRCTECDQDLGAASGNYREAAHQFDLPSDAGQPARFSNPSGQYVLRHYCCRNCGALFEIDLARAEDPPFDSISAC